MIHKIPEPAQALIKAAMGQLNAARANYEMTVKIAVAGMGIAGSYEFNPDVAMEIITEDPKEA